MNECLVFDAKDISILFKCFPDTFTEDDYINLAKYYCNSTNNNFECFNEVEFDDDGYVEKDGGDYLIELGNIIYTVHYNNVRKMYEDKSNNCHFFHKTYCDDCDETLFEFTKDVKGDTFCWSCEQKFPLNEKTIFKVVLR